MSQTVTLTFTLLADEDARRWLREDAHRGAWEQLYDSCPWRCPFLSTTFADVWYDIYRATWRPLIVAAFDEGGRLAGVFPLAERDAVITGVGAQQAEYQGWLSSARQAQAFFDGALARLLAERPGAQLYLRYVPPGAAAEATRNVTRVHRFAQVEEHARPLMRVDPQAVAAALKKKGNRSKWSRLRKLGEPSVARLSADECEGPAFDTIADAYDFRQGAVYGSCPFHEDPNKKALFQRWLRAAPEQVRIDVLRLDDRVVAALIGAVCGTQLANLVLAHAPELSRHSPGKQLIYRIVRDLDPERFSAFDLTPGVDSWKQRFADTHDAVVELTVWGDARVGRRALWRAALKSRLRTLLDSTGLSPSAVRAALHSLRRAAHRLRPERPTPEETAVYRLRTRSDAWPRAVDEAAALSVTCNDLDALCRFLPAAITQQAFLSSSLLRLEKGERLYCVADGGVPQLAAAVRDTRNGAPLRDGERGAPADGVVAYDLQVSRAGAEAADGAPLSALVHQIARDAEAARADAVYLLAGDAGKPFEQTLQRLGFERITRGGD